MIIPDGTILTDTRGCGNEPEKLIIINRKLWLRRSSLVFANGGYMPEKRLPIVGVDYEHLETFLKDSGLPHERLSNTDRAVADGLLHLFHTSSVNGYTRAFIGGHSTVHGPTISVSLTALAYK